MIKVSTYSFLEKNQEFDGKERTEFVPVRQGKRG